MNMATVMKKMKIKRKKKTKNFYKNQNKYHFAVLSKKFVHIKKVVKKYLQLILITTLLLIFFLERFKYFETQLSNSKLLSILNKPENYFLF